MYKSKARTYQVQVVKQVFTCNQLQLLDTGFLHADPHPGNLLRTPDGKIAVLDYGLMTEVGRCLIASMTVMTALVCMPRDNA